MSAAIFSAALSCSGGQYMRVRFEGDGDVDVAEALADDLCRHPGSKRRRRLRMAQIVQADVRQRGRLQQCPEVPCPRDITRVRVTVCRIRTLRTACAGDRNRTCTSFDTRT